MSALHLSILSILSLLSLGLFNVDVGMLVNGDSYSCYYTTLDGRHSDSLTLTGWYVKFILLNSCTVLVYE